MNRLAVVSISIALLGVAGFLLSLNGCGGGGRAGGITPPPNYNLPHVVIIFQENRTPDNLFQGLCLPPNGTSSSCKSTSPTASQYDIASSGVDSKGATVPLSPIDLGTVGANPDITITPASLGTTTQDWIGRSEYAGDPYLDASVPEKKAVRRPTDLTYNGTSPGPRVELVYRLGGRGFSGN